jgi:DNA-binding CsgD family transcriptional regulator
MIEREAELAALRRGLAAASTGQGAVIVVPAAGGLGKSTLLGEARRMATQAGVRCLGATGCELERDFPFAAMRQLVDPILLTGGGDNGAGSRPTGVPAGPWGPDPAAAGVGDEVAGLGDEPGYARMHAAYWQLATVALRQPLLALVDDAHWLDHPSLRFLHFLARRIEGLPLLLLVAFRPGEAGAGERLLEELADPATARLPLAPLTECGVTALVAAELGEPVQAGFARACATLTGGNPFFLTALLRELAGLGVHPVAANAELVERLCPRDATRYLQRRLATLPPEATGLAETVAVLGDGAPGAHLAAVSGLDRERVGEEARRLRAVGLLAEGNPPAFVHPIARAAVYEGIAPGRRGALHTRAARMLFEAGAAPDQVAAQLERTEPDGWREARRILQSAAELAVSRGAPETAATYLRRALREPLTGTEELALVLSLGRCEARAGLPEAAGRLRRVLAHPDLTAEGRAEAAVLLARVHLAHGDGAAAAAVLTRHAATLAAHPSLAARLDAELFAVGNIDLDVRRVVDERARQRTCEAITDGSLATALASYRAVDATLSGSSSHAAAEHAERALTDDLLLIDALHGGQNFVYAIMCLLICGHYERAAAALAAALARARTSGSASLFVILHCARSTLGVLTGVLGDAESDARVALQAARLNAYRPLELIALSQVAEVLVETGQTDDVAAQLSAEWVDQAAAANPQSCTALEARGRLRLARGETAAGVADLLLAGRRFVDWGLPNPAVYAWRSSAALGLATLGERDRAQALAREELDLARTWGAPRAIGVALRANGLLEQRARQLELLTEAVRILDGSGADLEHARALTDLGAALRRAGRRAEARIALREGLDRSVSCGATLLAQRARSELRSAGGRARTPLRDGVPGLTASEQRIAALAASGASNPQIAQSLFVTVKTVEMHLSSAYRKLGVSSRSQLPDSLAAAAAVPRQNSGSEVSTR